jgi:putative transposase
VCCCAGKAGPSTKKRVWGLDRLDGLQLRMKTERRKRVSLLRGHVDPATGPNQHWSMDFVHDQMLDRRKFRILTVSISGVARACL